MRNVVGLTVLLSSLGAELTAQHWPHWRGPAHNGVSTETGLPISWGAECPPNVPGSEQSAGGPSDSADAGSTVAQRGQGRGWLRRFFQQHLKTARKIGVTNCEGGLGPRR